MDHCFLKCGLLLECIEHLQLSLLLKWRQKMSSFAQTGLSEQSLGLATSIFESFESFILIKPAQPQQETFHVTEQLGQKKLVFSSGILRDYQFPCCQSENSVFSVSLFTTHLTPNSACNTLAWFCNTILISLIFLPLA